MNNDPEINEVSEITKATEATVNEDLNTDSVEPVAQDITSEVEKEMAVEHSAKREVSKMIIETQNGNLYQFDLKNEWTNASQEMPFGHVFGFIHKTKPEQICIMTNQIVKYKLVYVN